MDPFSHSAKTLAVVWKVFMICVWAIHMYLMSVGILTVVWQGLAGTACSTLLYSLQGSPGGKKPTNCMEVKWLFWDMEYIAIVLKGATATHKSLYRAQYPRPICPGPNLPWTCGKRMGFGQIGPREPTVRPKGGQLGPRAQLFGLNLPRTCSNQEGSTQFRRQGQLSVAKSETFCKVSLPSSFCECKNSLCTACNVTCISVFPLPWLWQPTILISKSSTNSAP